MHFVEVSTTLDLAMLAPEEFGEIGRNGLLMLQCMTEEEIIRMQRVVGVRDGAAQ